MLVFDFMVIITVAAAAAVTGVTPLFDFHEQDLKCQSLVREDASEMDELFEHVEQRSLLWTAAARDDLAAFALALHEVLADDDWFDDEDVVFFKQRFDFVADGRERGELDFDELLSADDINAVAAEALFGESAGGGVALFQLAVEGSLKSSTAFFRLWSLGM